MKLNKKFLSCLMATSLAVAPMSAYAETIPNVLSNGTQIAGEGESVSLDHEIYNIILPTDKAINFHIDPYGLLNTSNGTALDGVIDNAAGTVTSSATAVINRSTVPVSVTAEAFVTQLSQTKIGVSDAGVILVVSSDAADVKSVSTATQAGLHLAINKYTNAEFTKVVTAAAVTAGASTASVTTSAIDLKDATLDKSNAITSITSSKPTTFNFSLKGMADAYIVTDDAVNANKKVVEISEGAVSYTDDNTYVFAIEGYADPTSDVWKAMQDASENLALTMKFTFAKSETPETPAAPGFASTSYTYDKSDAQNVSMTLNVGDTTVASTAMIINLKNDEAVPSNPSDMVQLTLDTDYTYTDGVVTILDASWKNYPTGTFAVGVMLNNSPSDVYWTHVTIQD